MPLPHIMAPCSTCVPRPRVRSRRQPRSRSTRTVRSKRSAPLFSPMEPCATILAKEHAVPERKRSTPSRRPRARPATRVRARVRPRWRLVGDHRFGSHGSCHGRTPSSHGGSPPSRSRPCSCDGSSSLPVYCGQPKPIVWVATGAIAISLLLLARTPTPRRIALEIFGKLDISRKDALASVPAPPFARTPLAFGVAIAFPLAMWATRRSAFDDAVRVAIIVAFFAVTFFIFQTPLQKQPRRLALGLLAGFALAAAMGLGLQAFFDVGTAVAACTKKLEHADQTFSGARPTTRGPWCERFVRARSATIFAVLVVPVAEERIFRDVLQRALISRYGKLLRALRVRRCFGSHGDRSVTVSSLAKRRAGTRLRDRVARRRNHRQHHRPHRVERAAPSVAVTAARVFS